jgi:hypothetical protein
MTNNTAFSAYIQWIGTHCCSYKYFLEHLFILVGATLIAAFNITFPCKILSFMRSTLIKTHFRFGVVLHTKRIETRNALGLRLSGILHGVGWWFVKLAYNSSVI